MEKDRKFRALAIAAICIAVVGVSVAYAALTASLTITGTATVDTSASWNIHWSDVSAPEDQKTSSVSFVEGPSIVDNELSWAAKVTAPGDKFVIKAKVVNDGTLAAKLTGKADISKTGALAEHFTVTMKLSGDTAETTDMAYNSALGYALRGKGTGDAEYVDVVIEVSFADVDDATWKTISETADKTVKFTADLEFTQAADNHENFFNAAA